MSDIHPSPSKPQPEISRRQDGQLVHRFPFFYGWLILAVGTLGIIMTSPGQTYTVSIFLEHIIDDLDISRSLVSTLYAAGTLAGSLALPAVGRAIDRRGARFMVVAIALAFGLACIFMGFVRGPLTLGLGFVAIRMFGQGSLGLVSQNAINQWWVRRRGTMMGLSGLLASLLGLGAFPGLINWLIPIFGWRTTYILLGALLLAVMVPLGYLFFRDRPELYGQEPDGGLDSKRARPDARPRLPEQNWTLAEAMRTPAFWLMAIAMAVNGMLATGLFFHLVGIFADNDLSPTVAASVYLPIAVTAALVTLGSGALLDRISLRYVLATALLLQALSLWLVPFASTILLAFLLGLLLGTMVGLFRAVGGVAWAQYFGRDHLGSISSVASTILIVGASLGPIPLGLARDRLGSYDLALNLLAFLPLALSVAILFMQRPQKHVIPSEAEGTDEGAPLLEAYCSD